MTTPIASIGAPSLSKIGLDKVLGADKHEKLSVLAAKVVSDAGEGFRLNAALDDNESGRFSLVSGLTVAGNASTVAESELKDIKELTQQVENRLGLLSSNDLNNDEKNAQRFLLKADLDDIEERIRAATVGEYNLLDGSGSKGITLDVNSGAFRNTGTIPKESIGGVDRNLSYDAGKITYQTTDLTAPLDDLRSLQIKTFPGTAESEEPGNPVSTVARFKATLKEASENLKEFRRKLKQAAIDHITINTEQGARSFNAEDARASAARIAHRFSSESFNITANPALKFFSLFS